ncbi:4Fe-4S binding protein [Pseudoramibacter alactolyticus]|mgnify:FL=1|jgi:uncharacterized pyridoxamine 5'-phosphate oxidase family protein/NAD-dependent dihydropyrimidine dehydrogenase PreA subunit|uniref:4Fe-4S binding protein n=1 Tax=Pseudoramibacter alactolyticus TaxID=113287 RepID=UPI00248D5976|nr:4Fe-4S binding protein [Pseudoramibacter alactolyticus]
MDTREYLRILVEEIHSAIVATIDKDGHPVTRAIDMMLWDDNGVYFLTAKGKEFYRQLQEQQYISLSAVRDKKAISLRGCVENIGSEKLDVIFEKNEYMQKIYPGDTRNALEVFRLYDAQGEFFDISDPSHVTRGAINIGIKPELISGFFVGEGCIGCRNCSVVCPQSCIDSSSIPAVIDQNRCLHCGRCAEACPVGVIERRRWYDAGRKKDVSDKAAPVGEY